MKKAHMQNFSAGHPQRFGVTLRDGFRKGLLYNMVRDNPLSWPSLIIPYFLVSATGL